MRGNGRVFRPTTTKHRPGCTVRAPARCHCPRVTSALWWLDYSLHGKRYREPTGTASKAEAQRLLRAKFTARETGKLAGRPERVTFAQLRELAERQYVLDGRRSLDRLQDAFNRLEGFFGREARAPEITEARLSAYVEHRMTTRPPKRKDARAPETRRPASRATVNYELAALRRAFRLAIKQKLLATMPTIELPRVGNARSGSFEAGDLAALLLELPAYLRPLVRFLHLTGWRRSEALGLTWDAVDWGGGTIRLDGTQTKGGEPRVFPFGLAPDLKALLEAQWTQRKGECLFVFEQNGERIGVEALRKNWRSACRRAGLVGRLVHDLRRTAARDMRRAEVSEGVIMRLCGWRTRSMFDRYNVIDEGDLARAVAKRFNGKTTAKPDPAAQQSESVSSSAAT